MASPIQTGKELLAQRQTRLAREYKSAENPHGGPIGYMGHDVGEEYIVTIYINSPPLYVRGGIKTANKNRREVIVRTVMQEKFEMSTEAQWSPMTAATLITRFGREALSVFNRSNVNRWVTRRIWQGTSPLDFTLNLRFEAEYDAEREVLMPCQELHRITLPFTGQKKLGSWFLSPPGPAPVQWWETGEIIDVTIGNFLQIQKAVVKDVRISFNPKFQVGGTPLSANVNIHFQTFEIQTKESLDTEVYIKSGASSVNSVQTSTVPSVISTGKVLGR